MYAARIERGRAGLGCNCGAEGVARWGWILRADELSGVSAMKKAGDDGKKAGSEISAKHFPALRAFMRSYLHQDFGEEYGSVEEAAKAFCDDATEAEIATVSAEWRTFLAETRGRPAAEINNLLGSKLGSAWNLTGVDELNEITRAFDEWGRGKG